MTSIEAEIVALLPRLRRFAYALCRSLDDADDLVQGACERALGRLHQWQPGTRLDSWVYRIMQNLWIDQCRAQNLRGPHLELEEAADQTGSDGRRDTESRITLARVRRAMDELPEEQRLTLVLVSIEGFSYQEAADRLEVPLGTVMSRLSRARRRVHDRVVGGPDLSADATRP